MNSHQAMPMARAAAFTTGPKMPDSYFAPITPSFTTASGTWTSPEAARSPRAAAIDAHEAVHRVQFARGVAGVPTAPSADLEAEAERGAQAWAGGVSFTSVLAAPASAVLFHPPEMFDAAQAADEVDNVHNSLLIRRRETVAPALVSILRQTEPNAFEGTLRYIEQQFRDDVELLSEVYAQLHFATVSASYPPPLNGGRLPGLFIQPTLFRLGKAAEVTVARGAAFMEGFRDELALQLDAATLDAVSAQLRNASLLNAAFPPIVLAGAVHGAAADLYDTFQALLTLPKLVAAIDQMGRAIFGPDGDPMARALGADLARQVGDGARGLIDSNVVGVSYWMGRQIGPLLSDLLFAAVTGGTALLARGAWRVGKETLKGLDLVQDLKRAFELLDGPFDGGLGPGGALVGGPGGVPGRGGTKVGPLNDGVRDLYPDGYFDKDAWIDEIAYKRVVNGAIGGVSLDDLAEEYAKIITRNQPWSWRKDFPNSASLTQTDKRYILRRAFELNLVPDIPLKPGTRNPDFAAVTGHWIDPDTLRPEYKIQGLLIHVDTLPSTLYKARDATQFAWLDKRLPGGTCPPGYTWHHSEIPGRMELVPFGAHNMVKHTGGRAPGAWAHAPR